MTPTAQVGSFVSSIEAQPDKTHPIFGKPHLLDERVRTPLQRAKPAAA